MFLKYKLDYALSFCNRFDNIAVEKMEPDFGNGALRSNISVIKFDIRVICGEYDEMGNQHGLRQDTIFDASQVKAATIRRKNSFL